MASCKKHPNFSWKKINCLYQHGETLQLAKQVVGAGAEIGTQAGPVLTFLGGATGNPALAGAGASISSISKLVSNSMKDVVKVEKAIKSGDSLGAVKLLGKIAVNTGLADKKDVSNVVGVAKQGEAVINSALKGQLDSAEKKSKKVVSKAKKVNKTLKKKVSKVEKKVEEKVADGDFEEDEPLLEDIPPAKLTMNELKELLKFKGLKTTGKKSTLVARLKASKKPAKKVKKVVKGKKRVNNKKRMKLLKMLEELEEE